MFTLEQCVYLEKGRGTQRGQPFTTGPGTYKIPSVSDIPVELNVSLMDTTPNPRAIFSSKVSCGFFSFLILIQAGTETESAVGLILTRFIVVLLINKAQNTCCHHNDYI